MRPEAFCQADPQKVDLKRQCMDVMPHAGQRKMLAGHRHDGGRLCVSARLEVVRPQNRVLKKARPFTFFFTPRLTQPLSSRHHRVHDLRSLRRNAHSPTPPQGRCGATGWAGHDAPALQIVGRFSKVHAASIFNPAQNKRGSLQQGPSKIPRIDTQCHDPDDDRAGAASELPWENSHCTVSPTCGDIPIYIYDQSPL